MPAVAFLQAPPPFIDLEKLLNWDPAISKLASRLFHMASNPSPPNANLYAVAALVPADDGVNQVPLSCMPPIYLSAPGALSAL